MDGTEQNRTIETREEQSKADRRWTDQNRTIETREEQSRADRR